MPTAAARWARDLEAWAIPAEILAAAPEPPWGFPPELFKHAAEDVLADARREEVAPSTRRAREALPEGGSVLDIGVGGGAASMPLAPPAGRLIGVDESRPMLESFAALADQRGVEHREVVGRWPDVAESVGPADVVVCHHVFYNVARLEPFVDAMHRRARRRVVVELTETHPQSALNHLWQRFWGLERPSGPSADDAVAVLAEMGIEAGQERWEAKPRWEGAPREALVAFVRRRLCLPADRDPELAASLDADFELAPRHLVALYWEKKT